KEQNELGGKFLELFNKIAPDFEVQYNNRRNLTGIGFEKLNGEPAFLISTSPTVNYAHYIIPMTVVDDNTIRIEKFNGNEIPRANMDTNGNNFYTAINSLKELLNYLPGEYRIDKSLDPFSLGTVKLSRVDDSSTYVIISR
ncbi:MAG: hypothetical protein LBH89_04465, partial [Lactococcus lactis]|nr:hypothetical protein [Lactococcus lactis]